MTTHKDAGRLDNVADILPLSPVQTGILYECLSDDDRGLANSALIRIDLAGRIEPKTFREILADIALAPDSQRAAFVYEGISKPAQVIRERVDLPFRFEDLSQRSDQSARLDSIAEGMRDAKIDLTSAPLMRTALIRLSPEDHVLFWSYHHLVADGWSLNVLMDRIVGRLNGADASDAGPSFKNHLRFVRKRDRAADRKFWADELANIDAPTFLTKPDTSPGLATESCSTTLSDDAAQRLTTMAKRLKTTVATLLSVGWALCLRRLTGRDDVTFGTVVSGRDPRVPGIDRAVGSYAGIVPNCFKIDPEASALDLISIAQRSAVRRSEFEATPLAEILRSASLDGMPFDTLLSVMNFPTSTDEGAVRVSHVKVDNFSTMPLALVAEVGDEIVLTGSFDPDRLEADTVSGIVEMYAEMLRALSSRPDASVREMEGPELPALQPLSDASKPHLLIRQMARDFPDRPALQFGEVTVSYRELDDRAGALANELTEHGIGKGDLVPIELPRSERTVIAMLGVLYAGAAYVPIDPDYPETRRQQILDQVSASVLITERATGEVFPKALTVPAEGIAFTPVEVLDDDPAYVIFTSGSSGVPKGVVVSHGNLAWSNSARKDVYGTSPDAFLHLSSFAFDSSVVGLYWTLASGGKLVIASRRAEQDPIALLAIAEEQQITHLLALPELWRAFLTSGGIPDCLDTVIVAGEAVSPDLVGSHFQCDPSVRLFNEYGPTEGTVWCAAAELCPEMNTIPIGRPPAGAALDICDIDGNRLPDGVEGELVLRGQGVAQGYLNNPEATAAGFTQNSQRRYRTGDLGKVGQDGNLHFLGRLDSQVKVRGHRVELEEIESAARSCGATEAGAGVSEGNLVLAIEGDPDGVRSKLPQYLPSALFPLTIVSVKALPHLPNGKLDRSTIATMKPAQSAPVEATDGFMEDRLREHWEEALGVPIGRETHFFDAGGDSLKSIGLLAKAAHDGIPLKPGDIFTYPVLKYLAEALERRKSAGAAALEEKLVTKSHDEGSQAPFFMIHGGQRVNRLLSTALGPDRPLIFRYSHHMGGTLDLKDDIKGLAAETVETILQANPSGPYFVGGYSQGGLIALEAVRQLEGMGERVQGLFLVDPSVDFAPVGGRSGAGSGWVSWGIRILQLSYRTWRARRKGNEEKAIWLNQRLVNERYRPGPIGAPTILVLSDSIRKEADAFKSVLSDVTLFDLPCDHKSIQIDPDMITRWASIFARELTRLETKA